MAKELYEDNLVFADTMNVLFFDGKLEIQSHIHYAMPIRNLEYDALNLSRQLSARQKYNRENHLLKSKNEFLSGIKKGETFTPVLTVVVYLGKETWDAPETLHAMLDLEGVPDILRERIPNYQITLLQPDSVTNQQLTRMKSPLPNPHINYEFLNK